MRSLIVTILAIGLAGGLTMVHAQAQNSSGSGNGQAKHSKPAAKDKRPHPIQEKWGCNFGSTGSGASAKISNGVLIGLQNVCPKDIQKTFAINGPALMIGNNAYRFGYHTDAEARMVAAVFCQRAGGQVINHAGGPVESVLTASASLQYANSSFAVQSFNPDNPDDLKLNIMTGVLCQR
jgi:hypothetical protein